MSMMQQTNIKVGDTVGFSDEWLKAIGLFIYRAHLARGRVTAINQIRENLALAEVCWESGRFARFVVVENLIRKG